jgi:transposase-like protein
MFTPSFCPNPNCPHHPNPQPASPKPWYRRNGYYSSRLHERIPRFRCKVCGCSFSLQTFNLTYYDKLDVSYETILEHLPTCQGIRQMGRALGLSPKVVARRQAKLVPQVLSFHARALRTAKPESALILGRVESFVYSHKYRTMLQLLVGQDSEVVWAFNIFRFAEMTPQNPTSRQEPDESANLDASFNEALSDRCGELLTTYENGIAPHNQSITLFTDTNPVYPLALQKAGVGERWQHVPVVTPQPSGETTPLFAFHYLDRQLRKDLSEHVCQTTRWAKRPERQVGRLALYLAWHHAKKPVRINGDDKEVRHLERVALKRETIDREWAALTKVRRFGTHEPLEGWHRRVWNREDRNPELPQAAMPKYLRLP